MRYEIYDARQIIELHTFSVFLVTTFFRYKWQIMLVIFTKDRNQSKTDLFVMGMKTVRQATC